jgi:hypothetical protein
MTDGERLFVIGCLEYCQVEGDISDPEYAIAQKVIDKLKGECRVPVEGMRIRLRPQHRRLGIVVSFPSSEPPVDWDEEAKKLK